jgi:uncharacterized membrane protein HdeD (DUF308 family)
MSDIGASYPPPPPRPIEYQGVDSRGWWVSVLAGIALVVLGVWLLTNLYESVFVLALLVGVSLIVGGFLEAAVADDAGLGWVGWLAGALTVAAGVAVLVWPDITLWALAVVAGASLLVSGVLHMAWAMARRQRDDWQEHVAIGALTAVVGALVVAWPDATLLVLGLILGVRAVVTGLVAIATGWRLRSLGAA